MKLPCLRRVRRHQFGTETIYVGGIWQQKNLVEHFIGTIHVAVGSSPCRRRLLRLGDGVRADARMDLVVLDADPAGGLPPPLLVPFFGRPPLLLLSTGRGRDVTVEASWRPPLILSSFFCFPSYYRLCREDQQSKKTTTAPPHPQSNQSFSYSGSSREGRTWVTMGKMCFTKNEWSFRVRIQER